jgi:PPM family protein phosphatase
MVDPKVDKPRIRFAGASDAGRVRHNNEDALHADPERGIFLVVDGIGGQAAGERAAEIAVGRIKARLERQTGTAEQRIREAIAVANNEILQEASHHVEWAGMACVLTVAVLENGSAVVGHVGDSRLYQIRRGEIRKITHDHSPVGEREDNHELTEAEAMRHPRRNEIFRDVGSERHEPDDPDFIEVQRIPFEPDSALLLCSDGLSDQVASSDIRRSVERHAGNPKAAVEELIHAANGAGGKDNVTVVLVEGEKFKSELDTPAGPSGASPPRLSSSLWTRVAWFAGGLLVAAAAAWFTRSLWVPPPVIEKSRVLVVGKGSAYPTIAAALAVARPGDTIEALGGEYPEQVRLISGITLRSREPRAATILAAPMNQGPAVVARDVKDARFAGFRILAAKDMPVLTGILLENSAVEVDDVEIDGAGIGIEIRGAASPVLRADSIHDCTGDGILILGPSQAWISHNEIRRNKGLGLAAREGARPVLSGNVFEKNGFEVPPDLQESLRAHNVFIEVPGPRRSSPAAAKKE